MAHVDVNGASLGVEDTTPDALGVPDGATPATGLAVPTLVVVATHDPPAQRLVGEIDSDHHLTLREHEHVTRLLRDFLASAAPAQ